MTTVKEIWLSWISESIAKKLFDKRYAKAVKEKGPESVNPKEDESYWDWVEMDECEETRKFPSLAMAKGYGKRYAKLDMFEQPRITVNEYADGHQSEAETIETYEWQDGEWVKID